jgi:hypothetical protein
MSGRTRARLADLPMGQRYFVFLWLGLLVFIGIMELGGSAVAFVKAELRPPAPLLLAIPAYPGATAELRDDKVNPFVTSHQYRATTTDDVDTVWRWYKIRFPDGGWVPGKSFSTFALDGCPGGSVEVKLGPGGRGTMITVEMRHTGMLVSRLPLCQQ